MPEETTIFELLSGGKPLNLKHTLGNDDLLKLGIVIFLAMFTSVVFGTIIGNLVK